jgi:archaellum component FlaC
LIDKELKEVSGMTTTNSKDISGINEEQAVQNKRLDGIEGTIKDHSDHLQQVDDTLDGIQQTFGVVEDRHNETTKQLKEVALQSSGLPQLVQEVEDKVVAQSESGIIKLQGQVTELENKHGAADESIAKLETNTQA